MYSWLAPKCLQELFDVFKPSKSLHSSTDSTWLNLLLYNVKSYGLRSFSVCGPKLKNELTSQLRAVESKSIFKAKLKTRLLRHIFLNFWQSVLFIYLI